MSITPAEAETVRQYLDSVEAGEQTTINIVLLGQNGVGKRSIATRLASGQWDTPYDPTLEDGFRWPARLEDKLILFEGEMYMGNLDMPHSATSGPTMRACEACFLVYDVTSRASFNYLRRGHCNIHLEGVAKKPRSSSRAENPDTAGSPFSGVFVVIANKIDRPKSDWAVSLAEAWEFCASIDAALLPMSAKTEKGTGSAVLLDVTRRVFLRRIQRQSEERRSLRATHGRKPGGPGPLDGVLKGSFWTCLKRQENEDSNVPPHLKIFRSKRQNP
ncbi:hypothetical protein LTR85_005508 [Meristemomyces frigidus]|nr:hypothetical protein LTR85_005508 [Meristemomyces frigidus]